MPTDDTLFFTRKANAKPKISDDALTDLTIVSFWSVLGLVLSALMFNLGFGPALVESLVAAG